MKDDAPGPALVIALLGAESTGKSTLSFELAEALRSQDGLDVAVVQEYLREFCDSRQGRTPLREEQLHIAQEQTRRIQAAADTHAVVIADTTALTIAVHSELVFDDRSLYPMALAAHRRCGLTLLTAVDLPWQADPLREGPHVRGPVDALLRWGLRQAGVAYGLVAGQGPDRLAQALRAVRHRTRRLSLSSQDPGTAAAALEQEEAAPSRWRGWCDRCSDPACEQRCLPLPR